MTFCLDCTIIKPEKDKPIKNAIIMLHGYGGDGKDISTLTLNWKRFLPDTIFICPNGHQRCEINPSEPMVRFNNDNPDYILKVLKLKKNLINFWMGQNEYNFESNNICLSCFSQGCMMSINIGLTSKNHYNSVVGFSGKIINANNLKQRKKNSIKTLLLHGDLDDIVSPTFLLEAKDFFLRNNIDIQTHLLKNCGHNIPVEASSIALDFILKNLINK